MNPHTTPALYNLISFLISTTELFLKLPLETILRRGQVEYLRNNTTGQRKQQHRNISSTTTSEQQDLDEDLETVVTPGPYKGLLGTAYHIIAEEGERRPRGVGGVGATTETRTTEARRKDTTSETRRKEINMTKKGQGITGLWRGWRVGMWGLVGVWGAGALGSGGGGIGTEF